MAVIEQWQGLGGKTWKRVPVDHAEHFVLGVDLGQSSDPTAIAVLQRQRIPLDEWKTSKGELVNVNTQQSEERFDVVHLQRVALGTPYPEIVSYVGELLARHPLRQGCDLVIDETGVGRAVGDMFNAGGLHPVRVTITVGNEVTHHGRSWHVPKGLLVSTLDAKLHCGELRFAAELREANALGEELKDFRRSVTAAGRSVFNARSGKHDDLVLAVAIATWWARDRRGHQIRVGSARGFY